METKNVTPFPGTAENTQAMVPAAGAAVVASQHQKTMAQAFQGLVPTSIGEAFILAGYLAKSNAIPKSLVGKPESVLTVVLAGMELGLTPIRAVQSITNISGTLAMRADLQLGLARRGGVLDLYDESFEVRGVTDLNLQKRLQRILRKEDPQDQELAYEKVMAAAGGLKQGDPYAWALAKRTGEATIHVRTFTFADAQKAIIYEASEDGSGPKEKKPLSDKFNYKSFPGDMYPKRARTRVLQAVASDVLAGLPAVEAIEGGQILDAEFSRDEDQAGGPDLNQLLADIEDQDAEAATTIRNGFAQLRLGTAHQLQKLVQFKGKPADLVAWLKQEYANRRGGEIKRADVLSGDHATGTDQAKAADATVVTGANVKTGEVISEQTVPAGGDVAAAAARVADDIAQHMKGQTLVGPEPVTEQQPAEQPKAKTKAASLADRFRKGTKF